MPDLLIKGGRLRRRGRLERADLLVRDGRMESIEPRLEAEGAPILDANGCVILPGFVNAHYHSGESFNPGLYENLPLDLWYLRSHEVLRETVPEPEEIYQRTLLGAVLMLRAGTVAVGDFLFEAPRITVESVEPVMRAYRDCGLRVVLLLGVSDLPYLETLPWPGGRPPAGLLPEPPPPTVPEIMAMAEEVVRRWHDPGGLVEIGMGPSAPQRCSQELLDATMGLAREHGLVWHTHVQETRSQACTGLDRYGHSLIEWLRRRDLLGPLTSLVHTVWLSHSDVEAMASTGTSSLHCPASNLRLGDGVAPIPALLRAGVNVGLGTDGRGCDERLDVLELARLTALLHKVWKQDPADWPTAEQALRMATAGGSRSLNHRDGEGDLQPGAPADLVMVDATSATFQPFHDFDRQLVYGAHAGDLRAVVVAGRVVARDGRVTTVNEETLLRSVAERHAAAAAKAPAPAGIVEMQRQVAELWRLCEARALPVHAQLGPLPGGREEAPNSSQFMEVRDGDQGPARRA